MFTYPDDPVQAGILRIQDVLRLPYAAANVICAADLDQQYEWLRWSQCLVTNIPGQQFSDLFPKAAIYQYRDHKGLPLPGLRMHAQDATATSKWRGYMNEARRNGWFATGDPLVYWRYLEPNAIGIGLCDQENYLRIKALPTAINVLLNAFQNEHRVLKEQIEKARQG